MTCLVARIDDNWLWHKRFCHVKFDRTVRKNKMFAIINFQKIVKCTNIICKECVLAKHKKTSFPSKKFTTLAKLEIVHTDLSGPTKTRGFYGQRYFMILVDDFYRMVWVAFLKEKAKELYKFKILKNRGKNESGVKIKFLRSDRGGEFTLNEFNMFCEDNIINRQLLALRTLEQNGILERRNKSIIEAARAMLAENCVARHFGEKQ